MNNKSNSPVLERTITCHAWNKDRTLIAVCPNSNIIEIYATNGHPEDYSKWTSVHTLKEHDHHITAIDWAPNTNRIISCSHDRNAYVWSFDAKENEWKPNLVLLRFNRAATCCKWSPNENKFAVGSGDQVVGVCYYEQDNNWWVSKTIKKHESTVLGIAWHPQNNSILATASSDDKCRVFNAWIKKIDEPPKKHFGEIVSEYPSKGWVHDVKFSPTGNTLTFLSHDSTVSFISNGQVQNVKSPDLPFVSGLFLSDNAYVAVGYDYTPVVFCKKGDKWTLLGKADEGKAQTNQSSSSVRDAFAMFQAHARVGSQNAGVGSAALKTRHTNTINCILPYDTKSGVVNQFTTSGLDGRILLWKVDDLKKKFPEFSL